MKLKDLRNKEIGELQKELRDTSAALIKAQMEVRLGREKNVKKATELKRKVAVIYGLINTKRRAELNTSKSEDKK